MPRDVSLSDSKCWNGGHEWVLITAKLAVLASKFIAIEDLISLVQKLVYLEAVMTMKGWPNFSQMLKRCHISTVRDSSMMMSSLKE